MYKFKDTVKIISKHCLNVLKENLHLSYPSNLLYLFGNSKHKIYQIKWSIFSKY